MWQENRSLMRALAQLIDFGRTHETNQMQAATHPQSSKFASSAARDSIAAEIKAIFVLHLGVEEVRLTDDALLDDLGADRLDLVEIAMSCEEAFGIDIPNRAAEGFKAVGDVMRFVDAALAAPMQPARRPAQLLSVFR